MSDTGKSTEIENLAANTLETRFDDINKETVETTKYRIIDTLGCLIGGSTDTGNTELAGLLRDEGGKEEATILIHGGKIPAANAALVNCVMARSFDFEPVSPLLDGVSWPGHISGTTVPTAKKRLATATPTSGARWCDSSCSTTWPSASIRSVRCSTSRATCPR